MKTLTLAQIYELQGLKEEALEIYKEILKKDPKNGEARAAIHRLSGVHRHFAGVNETMKEFFVSMESDAQFAEFERWLAGI
ncbi:tetratricopeptide repeat protein [Hydrogenimonas urashimensis]|uniref:tetratricopeptide repeat protein n=1 Tax=Hydrogenimonas urashimensis TaxID=2740515 RepID=UPI00191555AD|nr:tetratricopeptide repeat protein [Hydrogenimonas urashimensis]